MTALSANKFSNLRRGDQVEVPVAASTTIYRSAAVGVNAAGYLVPADSGGNLAVYLGVALDEVDNSTGSAGDKNCRVGMANAGWHRKCAITGATQANVGDEVFWVDDDTVDTTSGAGDKYAGVIVEFVSSTEVWVALASPGESGV